MVFPYPTEEFFRPLVNGWLGKIALANKAKSHWKDIGEECMMFYSRSAAAMWDDKYGKRFWKGIPAPRFRVSINKAFELVSVFGPSLMWGSPWRQVEHKRVHELPIELFGSPEDPSVQEIYQQITSMARQDTAQDRVAAELMERWLNYTPSEQPGGGLAEHSMMAVTDSLVKGRGVMWVKPYRFPMSGRTLTGGFRESPDNLFIDPDYTSLEDAKWIAIRRVEPTWEVERRFKLEAGSLKNRSTLESSWAEAELKSSDNYIMEKTAGRSNDMIVYYEVWSKTGPGSRLTGMKMDIKDHLEDTIGDYAWIVVSPHVPYPLNCSTESMRKGLSTDDVADLFSWPVDYWADDRWPIAVLDYYEDPDSAWPIAPLAPALGELKFLNIMIPHVMNRIWSSTRDFWAVTAAAYSDFQEHLNRGGDQTIFKIPTNIQGSIRDNISVLQQPQTNLDAWRIIEYVSDLFDKRTGLNEFLYGANSGGTQDRTAETTLARKEASSTRPKYMRERVRLWQNQIATLEAFCSRLFVEGKDVQPLMGDVGAALWEQLIMSSDVELIARQMKYSVVASSIEMPDKERERENMSQAISIWLPTATQAGDFHSVNGIMRKWGEAVGIDTADIEIQPQQQDSEAEQMRNELEMQKGMMDLEGKKIDLQAKQAKAEGDLMKSQVDMQSKMMDAEIKSQETALDLEAKAQEQAIETMASDQSMVYDAMQAEQDLIQDQEEHIQGMVQRDEEHAQKMRQAKELASMQRTLKQYQQEKSNGE
jgi:hypothetical protein